MKKFFTCFILSLFLFSLCACGTEKVNWPGYSGTMEGYEYCHTDEEYRKWEEDILSLAEAFLNYHPKLVNTETKMFIAEETVD